MTLYLVLPSSDISRTKPLIRLVLNQIGHRLTEDLHVKRSHRINVCFNPVLSGELEALSARRWVSKSQIVEAALAAFLSPDGADQREAAIVRRLDRFTQAVERLERDQSIGN